MSGVVESETLTAQLVKVTFAYSLEEDRVRMDALDSDGGTVRLWFTARLLKGLVLYMVQRQSGVLPFSMTHSLMPDDTLSGPFEQQSVMCHADSANVLITTIDIHPQPQQLVLVFKDMECNNRLAFALSASAIYHWNVALKQCFEQAGWPLQSFNDSLQGNESLEDAITIH